MDTQLTIRIPARLSVKVRHKAERLGLKRSDIVRLALTEFLEEPEETRPLYDRVKHLVGSAKTGVPDLGERHRQHILRKLKKRG